MIHQLIFASPRPGMTEDEFQRYWVEEHAVKYASKIPQIRRYMVDTRVPFDSGFSEAPFGGAAEIWLANETEQLESLQSKEFLEGARADEPRWAAFWATIGLDTSTHTLLEGPPLSRPATWIKLLTLIKRKPGMSLKDFRRNALEVHGPLSLKLPGLRRCIQCHARDSLYVVGESRFDAVIHTWFDNVDALRRAIASPEYVNEVKPDLERLADPKYVFTMAAKEHWIIGPEFRGDPPRSG